MKRILSLLLIILFSISLMTGQTREQLIQKAKQCYSQGLTYSQNKQYDKAISCLTQAADIYKNISQINYAIINLAISDIYIKQSKLDSALAVLNTIRPIIESYKNGQTKFAASLFDKYGQVYTELNKIDSAKKYYFKALEISKAVNGEMSPQTAGIYGNLGNMYASVGNYEQAKYFLKLSEKIYEKTLGENSPELALTLSNLANIYKNTGNYDEALEIMKRASRLIAKFYGENSYEYAKALINIGNIYIEKEEYELALEYVTNAMDIIINIFGSQSTEVAETYYILGLIYTERQQYDKAIQFYIAALNIYKTVLPPNHPTIIGLYNNIAVVYRSLGNYETANEYYHYSLNALKKNNPNDYRIPIIYTNIAAIYYTNGQTDSAVYYYNLAINHFLKIYNIHNPNLIKPFINLGYVYMKKGDYRKALEYFQKSIVANCPSYNDYNYFDNPPITEFYSGVKLLEALSNKAAAFIKLYRETDSIEYLHLAYNTSLIADTLANELRQTIITEKDKLMLNSTTIKIYENAIFLARELAKLYPSQKQEYLNKAFYFGERNKAGLLVEAMNAAKAQKIAGIPDSLIQKEKMLREAIAYYENQLSKLQEYSKESFYRQQLFKYKTMYRQLIHYFEQNYPKYYKIKYSPNFVRIEKLQTVLKPEQAIISYFYGNENLYIFVITRDTFYIAISRSSNVADTVTKMYKNIKVNSNQGIANYASAAFQLFKMIFPDYLPPQIKHLIIIPDDILNIVPFEALLQNDNLPADPYNFADYPFLIKSFAISYSYSSYLFYTLHYGNIPAVKGFDFLGIAPGFINTTTRTINGITLSPLPGSIEEVKTIATDFTDNGFYSKILIDSAATETNFKHLDLTNYKIIHISTHGLIYSDHPEWSALAFYKETAPDDGFLYVGEIYNLKINSSLVTLSACETGLGKISRGEGVIGLSRAFFYAGAQNMIISLWQVSDLATRDLMIQFYGDLLKQYDYINENTRYYKALQQAKLQMINSDKWGHPYFWSSFILIGE